MSLILTSDLGTFQGGTSELATASQSIASEIAGVNQASGEVRQAVEQVNLRSGELARMGRDLKEIVEKFQLGLNHGTI